MSYHVHDRMLQNLHTKTCIVKTVDKWQQLKTEQQKIQNPN